MVSKIAIYGAGGLGKEVLQVIRKNCAAGRSVDCVAFVVDEAFYTDAEISGIPVFTNFHAIAKNDDVFFVVAIGDPGVRARTAAVIQSAIGQRFASVVDEQVWLGDAIIGFGTIVLGMCSLTVNVSIGNHVLVNPGCTIAHDTVVEDFATISPGTHLAGSAHLEEGCMLGIGVSVAPKVRIGRWSILGAGTVAISDIPSNVTAVGVPAQVIEVRTPGWQNDRSTRG
jgi:sugar O-acyltransferase (sialic acid O-acetyltransferase NeuD family)